MLVLIWILKAQLWLIRLLRLCWQSICNSIVQCSLNIIHRANFVTNNTKVKTYRPKLVTPASMQIFIKLLMYNIIKINMNIWVWVYDPFLDFLFFLNFKVVIVIHSVRQISNYTPSIEIVFRTMISSRVWLIYALKGIHYLSILRNFFIKNWESYQNN